MLSETAIHDPKLFTEFVNIAKANVGKKTNQISTNKEAQPKLASTHRSTLSLKGQKLLKSAVEPTIKVNVAKTEVTEKGLNNEFSKLKVSEIKDLLIAKGIEIPEKSKKQDLIDLLSK